MGLVLTPGFDISHFQRALTPEQAKDLRTFYGFGAEKVAEGTSFVDPHQAANREAFRAAGLARLLYHVGRADSDPATQAAHYLAVIAFRAGRRTYHLRRRERAALDVEASLGMTGHQALAFVRYVMAHARKRRFLRRRVRVVLYASDFHYGELVAQAPELGQLCPRWVARYSEFTPHVPRWVIWQNSNHDDRTGGDHDFFRGGRASCRLFFFR